MPQPFVKPLFFLLTLILGACAATQPDEESSEAEISRQDYKEEIIEVDTSSIVLGTFSQELISNGKLLARRVSKLQFKINAEIQEVRIKNGQYVRQGDTLAVLENFTKKNGLDQAKLKLTQAQLQMKDQLISFGYKWQDSVAIPENILSMARSKSGLAEAESQLELAKYEYEQSWLIAPFSGVIANLEAQPYNMVEDFKPFCTLMDISSYEAEFSVLENELNALKMGQTVEIIPFALGNTPYLGKIKDINPQVDEHGMVKVHARLTNPKKELIAGMNVKVVLKQAFPNQLIVPKEAVVLRQGREVVFTCVRDTAFWNYVKIGKENSKEYTIEEGIDQSAVLITTNNLNLAHKVKVSPR